MNSELTFRIIYAVVYLSGILIRLYCSLKASPVVERNFWKRWKIVAEREGKLSAVLWSIIPFFLVSFMLLYVILHLEWISWFALPLPPWLRWMGVSLGILAILLLFWVHQTIGEYWIAYLDLRKRHRLVTDGPYRWVRHPMYSQSIAFLVALSLVSTNLLMMLCSIITIILIFNRIPKEERMMIKRFGEEYCEYMRRTGRLLPRFAQKTD